MSKEYVDIKLAILLQLDTAGRNVILYIQIDLERLVQRELNTHRFWSGGFPPILPNCPWQYAEYSLRPIIRLAANPLRQNCFAHFGEKYLCYFGCGGRSLADARQGRQAQKSQTEPPKCGGGSTPVGLRKEKKDAAPTDNHSW